MARQYSFILWLPWSKILPQLLLFLLLLMNIYSVITDERVNNYLVECKDGDPEKLDEWFSARVVSWVKEYFLKVYGTRCYTKCFYNCKCTLNGNTITSNCSNGKTFSSVVPYASNIRHLTWADSTLHYIQPGSFTTLGNTLEILHLKNLRFTYLKPGVFSHLTKLEFLWLDSNSLNRISRDLFKELVNLTNLWLNDNQVQILEPGVFKRLVNLKDLWLSDNKLPTLDPGVFKGLVNLRRLYLNNNNLGVLHSQTLFGLQNLYLLDLSNNLIHVLHTDVFDPVLNLTILHLNNNSLQTVNHTVFNVLTKLQVFALDRNFLESKSIDFKTIKSMTELLWLDLSHNNLDTLKSDLFHGLKNLQELAISGNRLVSTQSDSFQSQTSLLYLHLDQNQLRYLPKEVFHSMQQLQFLNLSLNRLLNIPPDLFLQCASLNFLDLQNNPLKWIEDRSLSVLNKTTKLLVTEFSSCCYTSAHCLFDIPPSSYLTCQRLLPSRLLRITTWCTSILTILANGCAFYVRLKQKQRVKVQMFLISNLSISDFLMGIYLLNLLAADLYYKDYFPSHSHAWRSSVLCRIAGALSILSSEASTFFIMLISIDRLLGVKYTFSKYRLSTRSIRFFAYLSWFVAFGLSITSFAFSEIDSDFYSVSEVCVGLPISRKNTFIQSNKPVYIPATRYSDKVNWKTDVLEVVKGKSNASMYFSIATFTGLNLLCFIIVGYCYVSIFVEARNTTKKSGRLSNTNEEIRMAMKISLIVLTDFCCWVPIGILSILAQTGVVEIDPVAYAWIVTFVLPINSSVNPLLYTLGSMLSSKIKLGVKREGSSSTTQEISMTPLRQGRH